MCASIPAKANWTGAMSLLDRDSTSGAQAAGARAVPPVRAASTARKYSVAKVTSRWVRKLGTWNAPAPSAPRTRSVTRR